MITDNTASVRWCQSEDWDGAGDCSRWNRPFNIHIIYNGLNVAGLLQLPLFMLINLSYFQAQIFQRLTAHAVASCVSVSFW